MRETIGCLSHTPHLGTWPATQPCALTGNRTGDLSELIATGMSLFLAPQLTSARKCIVHMHTTRNSPVWNRVYQVKHEFAPVSPTVITALVTPTVKNLGPASAVCVNSVFNCSQRPSLLGTVNLLPFYKMNG